MIDSPAAEYAALALASDDVNGLYDLLFHFDRAFPDDLIEERLRAAKLALRNLVARQWVHVWYASWTSPDHEEAIEPSLVEAIIENPCWWQNHVDRMVWFGVTEAGRTVFARPESEVRDALSRPPNVA